MRFRGQGSGFRVQGSGFVISCATRNKMRSAVLIAVSLFRGSKLACSFTCVLAHCLARSSVPFRSPVLARFMSLGLSCCGCSGRLRVTSGEKMLLSGTDPESYITEYTLVYEDRNASTAPPHDFILP